MDNRERGLHNELKCIMQAPFRIVLYILNKIDTVITTILGKIYE